MPQIATKQPETKIAQQRNTCSCLRALCRVYEPLPGPQVDLLLALPRPKVLRRLWPMLGELGVGHVVLTGAERVEPAFFDAGAALAPEEVRACVLPSLCSCLVVDESASQAKQHQHQAVTMCLCEALLPEGAWAGVPKDG